MKELGFPGGSGDKESSFSAGGLGLIPGKGRSHGAGNGYPLQYSCLENSMDREAWQAMQRVDTTEQLTLPLFLKEGAMEVL